MPAILHLLFASCCLFSAVAGAEVSQRFGDYEVHYIAFNSTTLTPEIARQYRLERSGRRAIINISVLKHGATPLPVAVPARVEGTASNLLQQQQQLDFREIREGEAIYYLATMLHSNEELYRFHIRLLVEGRTEPLELKFEQKMYLEEAP